MIRHIYLDTIGCRLNQSELESYAQQFRAEGHIIVGTPDEADLMVLNSCAVTAKASADSRQKIRQAVRAGVNEIVVTGCWSSIEDEEVNQFPEIIQNIPNEDKDALVATVLGLDPDEVQKMKRKPIPGSRRRTRAFIKAQDGCDMHCTYCITRVARGKSRTTEIETILEDVQLALDGGVKEIVISGVQLGSWGKDLSPKQHLSDLVKLLLSNPALPRLRLSSIEPWDLTPEFFDLWQDERLCRQIHLPLQSGCDATLKRMGRPINSAQYRELVEGAVARVPQMAITTDIIVGFPGETEEEFAESLAFVDSLPFADGHVFTYSEREGTPAVKLPNQVHNYTRKERNLAMRKVFAAKKQAFKDATLGQEYQVLWEQSEYIEGKGYHLKGLTDTYLQVEAISEQDLRNEIQKVTIAETKGKALQVK